MLPVYKTLLLLCLLTLFPGVVSAQSITPIDAATLPVYSREYSPARNPFADSRAAIQLAQGTNRRILIEIGGNWCSWCHVLDRFLRDNPEIWNELHRNYVVLKINVGDGNNNEKFMSGLPPVNGYPHMFVSRADGSVLHSQDTAEFLHDGKYSAERFKTFLQHWSQGEPGK